MVEKSEAASSGWKRKMTFGNGDQRRGNRLRKYYEQHLAAKPPSLPPQRDIVREYHNEIIELIKVDGASLADVVASIEAHGERVLAAGLKAEILKQIGSVKTIRAGQAKDAPTFPRPTLRPPASSEANTFEDEDLFRARRPRV